MNIQKFKEKELIKTLIKKLIRFKVKKLPLNNQRQH